MALIAHYIVLYKQIRPHVAALFIGEISKVLFADAEYFGFTFGACSLRCRTTVLHLDDLRIADLHFFSALHTISLHSYLLFEDDMRLTRMYEYVNR